MFDLQGHPVAGASWEGFVVHTGEDRYPKDDGIDAISLPEIIQEIRAVSRV